MGNFLHRTTKQFFGSVPPDELEEPLANYISEPDMSAVEGVPNIYWKIAGDVVSEMTAGEKAVVDQANLDAQRDAEVQAQVDSLESVVRQIVKMVVSEINILRQEHGLADRTLQQVKTQIRNGLGT